MFLESQKDQLKTRLWEIGSHLRQVTGQQQDLEQTTQIIKQYQNELIKLQSQKRTLGIFSLPPRARATEQINYFERCKSQALQNLHRRFAVTPGQASGKIEAFRVSIDTLTQKKNSLIKTVAAIEQKQKMLEQEHKLLEQIPQKARQNQTKQQVVTLQRS